MDKDFINELGITDLLYSNAREKINNTISGIMERVSALLDNGDDTKLNALKIGTVFQLFFIDALAAGKKPADLTDDDWKEIAKNVDQYAVLEKDQSYSEFVFTLYANYIDISAQTLDGLTSEKNINAITDISATIRDNTQQFRNHEITEPVYIEACLWLSLEAMIKLLSCWFTRGIAEEYAELGQSIAQFAFEYGRYVLFSKEQAILERYIQNQYALDEQLEREYAAYIEQLNTQADSFQRLIDEAFTANIHDSLIKSAELARAAGVSEDELILSIEDLDSYMLD